MMRKLPSVRRAVAAATLVFVLTFAATGGGAQDAVPEMPAAPPPGHSIVPRTEPLAPKSFSLEERYLDAARRGDLKMLTLCLDKGADLRAKDGFGRSALLLAARDGHSLEMVKFLQARGLPLDDPDAAGRTALADAAGNGDIEMVTYLLAQGALVDRKDSRGQTPLYNAVLAGSKETAARLLAAGANANNRDLFQDTPLIGACNKGFDELARLLVDKGADPSLKDQEGRTARERAAEGATFCRSLTDAKPGQ